MKIISVASLKGGCAKTTTAVMLANNLPGSVLLVDLDHNNNTTDITLRDHDAEVISEKNVYHVLTGKAQINDAIYQSTFGSGKIHVLPATPNLAKIAIEGAGDPGIPLKFGNKLRKLDYDFIIIDTPPSLSLELRIALFVSDVVVSPVQMARWTLQGFDLLENEIFSVEESIGKKPKLFALPAMVTAKEIETMRELLVGVPFTTTSIPKIVSLKNSQNTAIAPKDGSNGSLAYVDLAGEVQQWQ